MAVRPTLGFAGWASGFSGSLVITEPTSTKKALGYRVNEVPASSEFNWALNLAYQWQKYFDDGILKGEVAVKSLVVSALAPTGASAIPGSVRVEALGATGGATAVVWSASYAPGTIFKDNIVSAWGVFQTTGSSGAMVPLRAAGFKGVTHPSVGRYQFELINNGNPIAQGLCMAQAWGDAGNAPARTGAFHGKVYGDAFIASFGALGAAVDVRCWDGNGDLQDPAAGIQVVVIGAVDSR